ncbi:unnamed protein product [Prunus brigantina]
MTWVSLLKTKGEVSSKFFGLTMAGNFSTMILMSSSKLTVSSINAHARPLLNRMVWLNERIDTYWK